MVPRRTCSALLLCVVLAAPAANAQQADYVIGPQDLLTITVWGQDKLNGRFTVETDGTFTFPLIGRVHAGGLTLRGLEAELRQRLADGFFTKPQVTVAIEQYRSQRVFVVGEVRSPGPYSLTGDITLIEALARAGSTQPSAGDEAVIVRPAAGAAVAGPVIPSGALDRADGDDTGEVIRVDIRDLERGVLGRNVRLRDGDTVFVPRAATMFVFGQVKNPGEYAIRSDTSVLQALSLAGGVTDRGSTNRIKIVRVIGGKKKEISVRLNDLLQAGDTVIVQERFF
jgi:polysaccharide export outer membrane protein